MFWVLTPYQIMRFANIFPHSIGCLFTVLFPLLCRSSAAWCNPIVLIFAFVTCAFFCPKSHCLDQCQEAFSGSQFYHFRSYVWIFNPFWVDFGTWGRMRVNFISIMWISGFPNTTYRRDCSFLGVCSRCLCWRLVDCKCVDLLLDSLFRSMALCQWFSVFSLPWHT